MEVGVGNPDMPEKPRSNPSDVVITKDQTSVEQSKLISELKVIESPEIFLTDDNIIKTQGSQIVDADVQMEDVIPQETGNSIADLVTSRGDAA